MTDCLDLCVLHSSTSAGLLPLLACPGSARVLTRQTAWHGRPAPLTWHPRHAARRHPSSAALEHLLLRGGLSSTAAGTTRFASGWRLLLEQRLAKVRCSGRGICALAVAAPGSLPATTNCSIWLALSWLTLLLRLLRLALLPRLGRE